MRAIAPGAASEAFFGRAFDRLPLACLAAVAAAAAVTGPGWSERLAPLPWLLSLAVVGLPHGAADFAISRRACCGWQLAGLWLAYAAIMALVAVAFMAAPVMALAAFAALSAWHFGAADADLDRPPPTGWARAVTAAARGCPTLAAPLAARPEATATAASELLALALPAGRMVTAVQVQTAGIVLAAVAVAAIVADGLLARRQTGDPSRWLWHLVALGVLLALGLCTDPLFSVGLSFLVWHSWRQMGPLAAEVTGAWPSSWHELAGALVAIHAAALPLLLPTWGVLAAAWWLWSPEHDLRDLAILSIGVYLVVTPAHELLGEILRLVAGGAPRRQASRWGGRYRGPSASPII
jgi:Brp/Blh family beta-carotene 15,15'-monooxygenase